MGLTGEQKFDSKVLLFYSRCLQVWRHCGGIFFDNRELQQVDEPIDNIDEILKAIQNKEFEKVDTTAKRICPLCNIPMVKQGSGTEVEIDSCNICGATFLDNGELTKLRELKNKGGEEIVNEALKKVEASMPKISGKPSGRVTFLQNFITNLLLKQNDKLKVGARFSTAPPLCSVKVLYLLM